MQVRLADRVRLEVTPEGARLVARAFLGDRELPPTQEMLQALAALCSGSRALPLEFLVEQGVFRAHDPAVIPPSPLALSGRVHLGLKLQAGSCQVTERGVTRTVPVRPLDSLPIAGFVPPSVLGPLSHLAEQTRNAWFHLLRAAHSRGRLVDPDRATALLTAFVDERLKHDPALGVLLRYEQGRFVPLVPLQQDDFAYPVCEVDLIDDRYLELSTGRLRYAVHAHEGRALGQLLGLYGGGCEARDLREAVASQQRLMGLAGGLVGTPMLHTKAVMVRVNPGCVAHLGHATLLANLGGEHVLIDPWFPAGSRADAKEPLSIEQLPPIHGIFITHHHWDHVNLSSLMRLPKSIPLYVPAQDDTQLLTPRTEALLRSIGFTQVHTVSEGDTVEIGQGGRVVAAPFTGEDPTDVGWKGLTWVLCHNGAAAWVHVDSGPDRFGNNTLAAAAELKRRHGPLDPVFATRRQERGTMVEHSWEFLFADPDAWTRPTENCNNDAAFLGALGAAAGGTIALYSEGGADWYPASTDFLRPGTPSARDAIQTYLWDDLPAFEAACPGLQVSTPGSLWRIGGGRAGELHW